MVVECRKAKRYVKKKSVKKIKFPFFLRGGTQTARNEDQIFLTQKSELWIKDIELMGDVG
jgi:hypothetical protein